MATAQEMQQMASQMQQMMNEITTLRQQLDTVNQSRVPLLAEVAQLRTQVQASQQAAAQAQSTATAARQQASQAASSNMAGGGVPTAAALQTIIDAQQAMITQISNQNRDHFSKVADALAKNKVKPSLIDTKSLGKPIVYQSKPELWMTWSFKFENYVASVHKHARDILEWSIDQDDAITAATFDTHFSDPSLYDLLELQEVNSQLYIALSQLLEGESLDIVRNVPSKLGCEAWRRLVKRYDPATSG